MTGTTPQLDTSNLPDTPQELFVEWFSLAVEEQVQDARAVTLATVDEEGLPDARIVDTFSVDNKGWSFATSAASAKAAQLEKNPVAALNYFWSPQIRAVRVRGPVELAPPAEGSDGSFQVWTVIPDHVEFWQAGEGYNATRIQYHRHGDEWNLQVVE